MEIKMLKTQVCANNVIGKHSAEHPIDVDFTIPDYCGEIERILKCIFIPRINSKSISGQSVMIDGHVTVRLIYCDKENRIYSFDHLVPFTKSLEINGINADVRIKSSVSCSYSNCRAVTQRKVDVHGAIEIKVLIKGDKKSDVVCDVDEKDIQVLKGSAPMLNSKGYCEKALIIDEEFEIGNTQPEITSVIRTSATPCISDMKIISGKVLLRGELQVCVLYTGTDCRPVMTKSAIPFSQVLDIDDANEDCKCSADVQVAYFEVKPKTMPSGQVRLFSVDAKLIVTGECFCQDEVPVILDAYSVRGDSEAKYTEIEFEKICCSYNETLICTAQTDFRDNGIGSVVDLWCEVLAVNSHFSGNNVTVNGTIKAFMLLYDANGNAFFGEKPMEFEHCFTAENLSEKVYTNPQVEAVSCTFTITGESTVEIRIELKITGGIYEQCKMPIVVDLVPVEGKESSQEICAATVIYFADAGEKIWDIARKYNSSVEEIMQINELTENLLPASKTLLIPIM